MVVSSMSKQVQITGENNHSSPVILPEKAGKLNCISVVAAKNQSNRTWFRVSLGVAAISMIILGICAASLIGTHTCLPVAQWVKTFADRVGSYLPLMTALSGVVGIFSLVIGLERGRQLPAGNSELKELVDKADKIAAGHVSPEKLPFDQREMADFVAFPRQSLVWGKHLDDGDNSFFIVQKGEQVVYLNKLSEEEKNLIVELRVMEGWLDTNYFALLFL